MWLLKYLGVLSWEAGGGRRAQSRTVASWVTYSARAGAALQRAARTMCGRLRASWGRTAGHCYV